MTDLDRAIAAAREALADYDAYGMPIDAGTVRDLLAALDAARGQAVACDCDWPMLGNCKSCAPPAAVAVPAANVTPMRQPRADLARLVESINAAVYANGDGLSVTEAIGALELAKLELLKEQEQ